MYFINHYANTYFLKFYIRTADKGNLGLFSSPIYEVIVIL